MKLGLICEHEAFRGAVSQRTKSIKFAHGIYAPAIRGGASLMASREISARAAKIGGGGGHHGT